MTNPSIALNKAPQELTLKDLLDLHKKDIFLNLNCHAVATIVAFDPELQTATATINYTRTFFEKGANGQAVNPTQVKFPALVDCPVMFLGGGATSLTFPVEPGNECLVLFNDRAIDNWFQSGQVTPLSSSRLHSFSDAILLVGLRSTPNVIPDFDTTRAALSYEGGGKVGVGPSKVLVGNAVTTLNTLLQNLVTAIKDITTTNCVVGSPVALSPVSIAALSSIATELGGLLE